MSLTVPTMAEMMAKGESPEILFWVGCSGSFDDRAKKIALNYYFGLAKSEANIFLKAMYFIEGAKLRKFESILNKANIILPLSRGEFEYFNKNYKGKAHFLPVFHGNDKVDDLSIKGDFALYHGDLSISDNIKAVRFIISIFEKVSHQLVIASSNIPTSLLKNDLTDLSVIYFTGAWVEGMNIGTHTMLGNDDHKISVLLSEQMTIARSIIRGLRAVKSQTEDLVDLTDHVEEVVNAYHNLWSVKQEGENIEYLDVELKHEEALSISKMILIHYGYIIMQILHII